MILPEDGLCTIKVKVTYSLFLAIFHTGDFDCDAFIFSMKNIKLPEVNTLIWCCVVGDGKCVICDSYVRPATLVRVCDECNYGSYAGRCVICGGVGISDAYYCKECTQQEKDVSKFSPPSTNFPSHSQSEFY